MKPTGSSRVHLAFILGAVLSLYLPVRASVTEAPLGTTESPAIPGTQNPTSQEPTEPRTVLTTMVSQEATTTATQTSAFQPASPTETSISQSRSPPLPTTRPPEVLLTSFYATATTSPDQGSVTLGKEQATANAADNCEKNSKRLMLICFIIIGILVFICALLLFVIGVLASKMSRLKRRQPSKRLPRSNGDFLSGNSLWPLGLETLRRMSNETPVTDPKTQGPGLEMPSASHEPFEEAGKKLAREISNRQKHREMPQNHTTAA